MKKRILSFVAAAILALAMAPGLGASANSPEVSIEGINNGTTLEYKDSHTFVVDALQGNAQRVLLYVNGEAAGEASAYPYAITTDKIQVGINKLYAVAFDRDNEKFTSQTYNIKVTHIQSMNVLEKNDGSVVPPVTNWARYNWTATIRDSEGNNVTVDKMTAKVVDSGEERGQIYELELFSRPGTGGNPSFNSRSAINTRIINSMTEVSVDIKKPHGTAIGELFLLRLIAPVNTTYIPASISADGNLTFRDSDIVIQIDPDRWYNYKILIDNSTQEYKFFLDGEFIMQSRFAYAKVTSIDGIRITFSTSLESSKAYMDNLIVQSPVYTNHIDSAVFVDKSGNEIQADNAPAGAVSARLYFQGALRSSTVVPQSVVLYEQGKKVGNYSALYNESQRYIQVNFLDGLQPQYDYRIVCTTNVANSDGRPIMMDMAYVFTVDEADFDVKSLTVKKDGKTITNLQKVRSNDNITVEIELENRTNEHKQSTVVLAIYSANQILYLDTFDGATLAKSTKHLDSGLIDMGVFDGDIQFEVYLLDNLVDANPQRSALVYR